jgi:hypothetical protein
MALMVLWTIYGAIAAVNVMVWLLVVLTVDGPIHPWPVWVIGPPGAALLAVTVGVQAIRAQRR